MKIEASQVLNDKTMVILLVAISFMLVFSIFTVLAQEQAPSDQPAAPDSQTPSEQSTSSEEVPSDQQVTQPSETSQVKATPEETAQISDPTTVTIETKEESTENAQAITQEKLDVPQTEQEDVVADNVTAETVVDDVDNNVTAAVQPNEPNGDNNNIVAGQDDGNSLQEGIQSTEPVQDVESNLNDNYAEGWSSDAEWSADYFVEETGGV